MSHLSSTVLVAGIAYKTSSETLANFFGRIGPVEEVSLMVDSAGNSKGFAFITFTKPQDADYAVANFHGQTLDERRLRVEISSKRKRFRLERKFESMEPRPDNYEYRRRFKEDREFEDRHFSRDRRLDYDRRGRNSYDYYYSDYYYSDYYYSDYYSDYDDYYYSDYSDDVDTKKHKKYKKTKSKDLNEKSEKKSKDKKSKTDKKEKKKEKSKEKRHTDKDHHKSDKKDKKKSKSSKETSEN